MAVKKKPTDMKKATVALFDKLNKDGSNVMVSTIGDPSPFGKIERISTGIEDLDNILGGGLPKGRFIEIYGAESSGKTTLLLHLLAQVEQSVYHPVEGTYDEERAKIMGCVPGQLNVVYTEYGEQTLSIMKQLADLGMPLQGVDSLPALRPKEVVEKIDKSVRTMKPEEPRIGAVARLLNNWIPSLTLSMEQSGATIIFINQTRANMNAMPFVAQDTTPGGQAIKFAYSVRLKLGAVRNGDIKIPNPDPNSTADLVVGKVIKVKVVKNKVGNPKGECQLALFFDRGFVSFDDIEPIREEMKKANKEKKKAMALAAKQAEQSEWDEILD